MRLSREQTTFILNHIKERCPQCGDRSWYLIDHADSRKPTLGPPCPDDQDRCSCAFVQCGDCGSEYYRYVPAVPA